MLEPDEAAQIAQLQRENAELKVKTMQLELAIQVINWRPTANVQSALLQQLLAYEADNNLPHIFKEVS